MSSVFPPDLHFAHPWRDYQARVLAELEPHLSDGHLHVVAAPGAGKTILGLEVMRRLGRRALVVAPTLTIRNQWCDRFVQEFSSRDADMATLVSRSTDAPAPMTVTTYQGLHAAMDDGASQARLLAVLSGVGTLVLDEAHHLHKEWWKALIDLKRALADVTVLSLTATPPFDVSATQWNRYIELCGTIDAEIAVPELVASGDLCPHQDYVALCLPEETERAALRERHDGLEAFRAELLASSELVRAIAGHPQFANFDTDAHREAILSDPALFCAMVIVGHALGIDCRRQRAFLGGRRASVPEVADEHLESLLNALLFSDEAIQFDADDAWRDELRARLESLAAVERKRVRFDGGRRVQQRLRASSARLEAVVGIHELEAGSLGDRLRMVVLTDHVRREDLGRDIAPDSQRMGAIPLFERLRAAGARSLCVLTGGLVILPRGLEEAFAALLEEAGVARPRAIPHPHELDFILFNINAGLRQGAVAAATRLFNDGQLRVIVGTTALLAEGWDAQAANTLIMASAVSTHMLSNQMRGRVIRVDRNRPDKASNIWHLACIEPTLVGGGSEFQSLRRRFNAFQGVCYEHDRIESGYGRVHPVPARWTDAEVERANTNARRRAIERGTLAAHWGAALGTHERIAKRGLVEELRTRPQLREQRFPYRRPPRQAAIRGTLTTGAAVVAGGTALALSTGPVPLLAAASGGALLAGAALRLPQALLRSWRVRRLGAHGEVVMAVAHALCDTLCERAVFTTPRRRLRLRASRGEDNTFACDLRGATLPETSLFMECLAQALGTVENPRYVLSHPAGETERVLRGALFHPVPDALGTRENAECYAGHWRRRVAPCTLTYTRSAAGRRLLLYARTRAWAEADFAITERVSCWK